jgi:hypothetical protein
MNITINVADKDVDTIIRHYARKDGDDLKLHPETLVKLFFLLRGHKGIKEVLKNEETARESLLKTENYVRITTDDMDQLNVVQTLTCDDCGAYLIRNGISYVRQYETNCNTVLCTSCATRRKINRRLIK